MNEEISNKTLEFVKLLKKNQVYVDYLNYKSLLEKRPELYDEVNAFRKQSFEIQAGHKYGYFNAYENLLKLHDEHDELLGEPIVRSFLQAELELSKVINQINQVFSDAIDFNLDFLED